MGESDPNSYIHMEEPDPNSYIHMGEPDPNSYIHMVEPDPNITLWKLSLKAYLSIIKARNKYLRKVFIVLDIIMHDMTIDQSIFYHQNATFVVIYLLFLI